MPDRIIIERLEFRGRCGLTAEERARLQPLAVDLELDCGLEPAGRSDKLSQTIDYARVAQRVVETGTAQECRLMESLAERLLDMLFDEFPIARIKLWVRKLHPPIAYVAGTVGVVVERARWARQLPHGDLAPAHFLVRQLHRLPKGKVLDIAAGLGRHSLFLASQGYDVVAVDRDMQALATLSATARARNFTNVTARTIDLELTPPDEPDLGKGAYDVIIVFFYLQRSLFPSLIEALKPGGVLLYETFTIDNYFQHKHPRRWEFCLAHNELLRLTSSLQVLSYDEGGHGEAQGTDPVYTAQLFARKPTHAGLSA